MRVMVKKTAMPVAETRNPRAKGLKPVVVRLDPAQIVELKREAMRRALERGSLKPDQSEIVREAVSAWLKKSSR